VRASGVGRREGEYLAEGGEALRERRADGGVRAEGVRGGPEGRANFARVGRFEGRDRPDAKVGRTLRASVRRGGSTAASGARGKRCGEGRAFHSIHRHLCTLAALGGLAAGAEAGS
jgi:hypothetical protein